MAPTCLSFITLSLTTSEWFLDEHRGSCFLGVTDEFTFKWWQMKVESTPGASWAFHANTSTFFLRNYISSFFSWRGICAPTWKYFSGPSPTTIFSKSSHFASSASPSTGDTRVFDCYEPLSAEVEGSASSWCKMATTKHFIVVDWLPTSSSIWSLNGYFTF